MAKYMIEAPHTATECKEAAKEILAQGSDILDKFQFGCMVGVHNGWALVEAESESAARDLLPASRRATVRVTEVTKITPEQLEAAH